MALIFKLNNRQIQVETNASFTSVQDKNLDGGTLTLAWNGSKHAIFPYTKLQIYDTLSEEKWNFVVVSDEVEIVKKTSPVKYVHHLLVSENTHNLSTRVLRNTRFSQPLKNLQSVRLNAIGCMGVKYTITESGYAHITDGVFRPAVKYLGVNEEHYYKTERIHITEREKNANDNFYIEVKTLVQPYGSLIHNSISANTCSNKKNRIGYNIHKELTFKINYFENKDDELPSEVYFIQAENGQTKVKVPSEAFFGAGWYELTIDDNSQQLFDDTYFSSSDLSFTLNGTKRTDGVYPTISAIIQASLRFDTFYYSLYDVLEIIRKQSMKIMNSIGRFESPYQLRNDDDFLKSIPAPEFNFNGKTLFDAVSEVFDYIDAVPVMDENGYLSYEFINQLGEESREIKFADYKLQLTEENYSNKILTNYQNGKTKNTLSYPAKNIFRRSASRVYGVPTIDDYIMQLSHRIDNVEDVLISALDPNEIVIDFYIQIDNISISGDVGFKYVKFEDITLYNHAISIKSALVEQSEFDLLSDGEPFATNTELNLPPNLKQAISWTQGNDYISFGGQVHQTSPSSQNFERIMATIIYCIKHDFGVPNQNQPTISYSVNVQNLSRYTYNVEFYCQFDGRVQVESPEYKHEGDMYVNQSNANVELGKMGENMLGLIQRSGNERFNATLPVVSYEDRYKKGRLYLDSDNNRWYANKVKTTFSVSKNKVINEVEFIKNFNALAQFTQLDQDFRFYEISERITSKGYENVNEYIYLTYRPNQEEVATRISMSEDGIRSIFQGTLIGSNIKQISLAKVGTQDIENLSEFDNFTYIPVHSYGVGNVISFEMGFESPINAGNRIDGISTLNNVVVPYVNENGFADIVSFYLYSNEERLTIEDYPLAPRTDDITYLVDFVYNYYKKPNEILHFNYGIAILPYFTTEIDDFGLIHRKNEEIYIGEKFVEQNACVLNSSCYKGKLKLYTHDSKLYTFKDKKVFEDSNEYEISNVILSFDVSSGSITIESYTTLNGVSWAIADEDKNIYLCGNKNLGSSFSLVIYLLTSQKRL